MPTLQHTRIDPSPARQIHGITLYTFGHILPPYYTRLSTAGVGSDSLKEKQYKMQQISHFTPNVEKLRCWVVYFIIIVSTNSVFSEDIKNYGYCHQTGCNARSH